MSDHTFITYKEITGNRPSESVFERQIATLNKETAFKYLSNINNFLALFPISLDESKFAYIQKFLAYNLFDQELHAKLFDFLGDTSLVIRPIFHRQQVLLLMKMILLRASNDRGISPNDSSEARNLIGVLCLMASDLTVSKEQEQRTESQHPHSDEESERIFNELLVQFLPVFELNNPPEISSATVRTLEYIRLSHEHFAETFGGKTLSSFFESLTGISLEQFLQLIFGIYASLITKNLEELIDNPANFNVSKSEHFSKLDFSEATIESFYKLTSIKYEEIISELETSQLRNILQLQHDFTVFRKNPIFHLSQNILTVVDFSFLVEKVSIGLYYTILNVLNENELDPQDFFQHWGYVFEKYVNNVFRDIYPALANRFHPNTFFDTKTEKECFDGIIEYPNSLLVMEYKGGLLNTKAKYSGDVNLLLDEMGNKYGITKKDSAIKQLTTKIELLFHVDGAKRSKIRNLELLPVANVYPIIVLNELSMGLGLAHWRLRKWFKKEINTKTIDERISVKPLLVLTIEDLEMLIPYLEADDFTFLEFAEYYSTLEYIRFHWFLIKKHWYEPMTDMRKVFDKFRQDKNIVIRPNQKRQLKWENFKNEIESLFKAE
jgi:hypothetical protein